MSGPFIQIGDRRIGGGTPPYLIAEIACAHDGDAARAVRLAEAAAAAGADAIQLQIFRAEELLTPDHPRFEAARMLELPPDAWREVIHRTRTSGLDVWVTVFGPFGLTIAREEDVQAIKLHSADLGNTELIVEVGELGCPVSLGVGGSTLDEIVSAVAQLRDVGASQPVLMLGIQSYPTALSDCQIRFLPTLQALTGCAVGYQDHVAGDSPLASVIPLVAAGAGAAVIEKHIVDDRSRRGADHQSALEPDELRQLAGLLRQVAIALGTNTARPIAAADAAYRDAMKKVVVAAHALRPGHRVTRNDLRLARPSAGSGVTDPHRLVGRVVARPIPPYAVMTPHDVEP